MSINIGGASSVQSTWATAQTSSIRRTEATNYLALLTPADQELVFQATGQRVDAKSTLAPMLAFTIGIDRANGGLAGKEVDEAYLQQLKTLYNGTPEGRHWLPTLDRALDYLAVIKPGSEHVDIRS